MGFGIVDLSFHCSSMAGLVDEIRPLIHLRAHRHIGVRPTNTDVPPAREMTASVGPAVWDRIDVSNQHM